MAQTLVRKVMLRISADDGDTEAKLDKISLKADELAAKHPELKVRINTAAASAKMAVLRSELRGLSRQADEEALKGGIFSRFFNGIGAAGGLKLPEGIPGIGGAGLGGIAAAIPVIAGLLVEVDGLASGFAAAAAGAGAFGLLALPAFKSVATAYSQIQADQTAYNRALTKTARSTALAHLRQDYANLSTPQKDALHGVQNLVTEYHKMSNAFAPSAFKVFNGFLTIAGNLLPAVAPFAQTFATALTKLLDKVSKFTESKGFKDWLKDFQKLEGPAIGAIGTGIGHVATAIGKLFTKMSAKDVVNAINIAFSIIDGTILGLGWVITTTMRIWDRFTSHTDQARHQIGEGFDWLRHKIAELGHDVAVWFGRIRHDIARWADDVRNDTGKVTGFFRALPGRIAGALAALPGQLFSLGRHAVSMLVAGLKSIPVIGPVIGWAQDIASYLPHSPAKKGPLSGAGSPDIAGRRIGLMLAAGMDDSRAAVAASMARTARAAQIAGAGRPLTAAYGGGGALRIELEWTGGSADDALITLLKRHIRVKGGDPAVLGA